MMALITRILDWIKSKFWTEEMELTLVGLQCSGKTTFVHVIASGQFNQDMIPTVGFNMRKVTKNNVTIKIWDIGGQPRFRSMWERYCRGVNAIVYMVDAADTDKLEASRNELHNLIDKPQLAGIPVLVLGNKRDLPNALDEVDLIDRMNLNAIQDREICCYSISCKEQENIDITLQWLISHSKSNRQSSTFRPLGSTVVMGLASKEVVTVASLCCVWYIVSSGSNVVGKTLLNQFPYPMTVTMVQLLSIAVYSGPFFNLWGVRRFVDISWPYYFKLIVPLALGKFVGSVFTHVSLWKVPVSYTHTVKATMPLFSVVLSRIILGEKQCLKVYLSLVPIIAGVAIASFTEISFDVIGLMSALAATLQHTLQNIFSKKVLHDTGIHHLRLLHILGRLALVMFLPVWLYFDFWHLVTVSNFNMNNESYKVLGLLFTDGILSWLQNILAFSVMSLVTSLTYAVASSSKRIFVVAASLFVIGNPVTMNNVCGMALALFGVIAYNKAKYDSKRTDQKRVILPMTYQQTNNSKFWHNGYLNLSYTNNNKSLFV